MADQKINALPIKTSPATGDKVLMVGTAEEYQMLVDDLATAVLNKLSTQSFSSLDTTSKTVLGAIDELNSKSYLLEGGTEITSNADMNTYSSPGNYYCRLNNIASTLKNCPFTHGFILKVSYSVRSALPAQTYIEYDTGRIAYRSQHTTTSDNWSEYVYFSDDTSLFAGTAIKSGDDLNDYTTPGIYKSTSSGVTATLLNMPEIFVSGFSMLVLPISAGQISIQVMFTGGVGGVMYTRSSNSFGWQSWYKFSGTVISS